MKTNKIPNKTINLNSTMKLSINDLLLEVDAAIDTEISNYFYDKLGIELAQPHWELNGTIIKELYEIYFKEN